jgi:hypothetical protein|tara:strand:- start:425 stop:892 length:468 start_codon:yes stop_codon:yes gene_type:complete
MAHFAELESKTDPTGFTSDTHLVVKRVVVVANDIPVNGGTLEDNDCHVDGETWCVNFFGGGTWKQTSYNNNFRKQYSGIGYTYNASKDKFLRPQPYNSWSLNSDDDWKAPITYPSETSDKNILWDEDNLRWVATSESDSTNTYYWDVSDTSWKDL